VGPQVVSAPVFARMLLRPCALADRPLEVPVAAACILALGLVFIGDVTTPIQIAVSGLGLIPLLAAMWLLSLRMALVVGAVAVGQLLVTGVLGTLNPVTVVSELTAYVVLALVCRLYAASLADLLFGSRRPGRLPEASQPARFVTLTGAGRRGPAAKTDSLTKRERQVARLAAQGYTAREIGTQLHIGKRTVETHLANAYDKLGVRSKRELIQSGAVPVASPTPDA
jgi:DNA-binding CsgD family transcriptional regulator